MFSYELRQASRECLDFDDARQMLAVRESCPDLAASGSNSLRVLQRMLKSDVVWRHGKWDPKSPWCERNMRSSNVGELLEWLCVARVWLRDQYTPRYGTRQARMWCHSIMQCDDYWCDVMTTANEYWLTGNWRCSERNQNDFVERMMGVFVSTFFDVTSRKTSLQWASCYTSRWCLL